MGGTHGAVEFHVARQLQVVPQQQLRDDNLDLVRGEEPPRAGVPAEAERQARGPDGDELLLRRGPRRRPRCSGAALLLLEAEAVVAQGVEDVRGGEDGRVGEDGGEGDFKDGAGGDGLAGGEGHGLEDHALKGGCTKQRRLSVSRLWKSYGSVCAERRRQREEESEKGGND